MSKKLVFTTIEDLVGAFVYYDRKEDEELPRGAMEDMVANGEITVEEMVVCFKKNLRKHFDE